MFLFIISERFKEFTDTVINEKDSLDLKQLVGWLKPTEEYHKDCDHFPLKKKIHFLLTAKVNVQQNVIS